MSDSAATIELQRARLLDAYWDCNETQQEIVQLYAMLYGGAGRSHITTCLRRMGRNRDRRALQQDFQQLEHQQLIVYSDEGGRGTHCNRLIVESVTRDAIAQGQFERLAEAILQEFPPRYRWPGGPRLYGNNDEFMRAARLCLYRGKLAGFEQLCDDYETYFHQAGLLSRTDVFEQVVNNPFDPDWLTSLEPFLQDVALIETLTGAARGGRPALEAFDCLLGRCQPLLDPPPTTLDEDPLQAVTLLACLCEQQLWRGNLAEAESCLLRLEAWASLAELEPAPSQRGVPPLYYPELWGWLALLQGETERAIAHYDSALKALKKATGKRKIYFAEVYGIFYLLLLISAQQPQRSQQAQEHLQLMLGDLSAPFYSTYLVLAALLQVRQGDLAMKANVIGTFGQKQALRDRQGGHCVESLIHALAIYWLEPDHKLIIPTLMELYRQWASGGYQWLALEVAELLARFDPESTYPLQAEILGEDCPVRPLIHLIQAKASWEIQLGALAQLYQPSDQGIDSAQSHRLVWWLTIYEMGHILQPREQKLNAKGNWSKGRPVAVKRLTQSPEEFNYLTPQDRRICQAIEISYPAFGAAEYHFGQQALVELIDHPLVFWEDHPEVRLEVLRGQPEVRVLRQGSEQLQIEFFPPLQSRDSVVLHRESPTRLRLFEINDEHRHIAEILGNRLQVPAAAEAQVLEAIQAISSTVTVQSDIGGGDENAEVVPTDPKPHLHLLPAGDGLKVSLLCRPFGAEGPYYRPGQGGETVIAELEGRRVKTQRLLPEETRQAEAVVTACPHLVEAAEQGGEWLLVEPVDCLELLSELQELGDRAVVEWPQGEKLRVTRRADLDSLQLRLQRQGDWFGASGQIQVADDQVVDMQRVLELLSQSQGRFVQLEDGQFLALSETFRQRLEELAAFSDRHKKGLRLHPLASAALEDWVDDIGELQADQAWQEHLKTLRDLDDFQPQRPSTLQAELRDYQLDGFRWLARLAHWGVGACLADDMGLGKTLQALALILTRAPQGPTLVLAPTSVGLNWIAEAQKFAPTLNPIAFGGRQRQQTIETLEPFDLVVCTYGLLQQPRVAELLASIEWETIVLDEAQAIKNATTKRSKAAMQLQGNFKLLTTGTPIENHLGELWNLFRFINPGLLGSLDQFNQRFAGPIERNQDKAAKARLKKLIQPFILRRTKTQVLSELPSRTEILLNIELSQAEMTLYEAMRREALARLSQNDGPPGQKSLQVLAEIMKLRRLCCNPRLVLPESNFGSAKLETFSEVLAELLDNNHKALVFSQFVDHLAILREHLEAQGISYQYLDGSTPTKQRQQRVNAFQAGEGDVFLISLKAGGTGLNLTAADYVIHMDPWWNPAVEDQASDRAHRMGQLRPVTIYRLVAQGTIEEKIVELHQQKRDLADSLLEGTESSSKISTDDLLKLIQEA